MKITYCKKPYVMEFGLYSSPNKFFDRIKKLGYVYVDTKFHTKTRVATTLYVPGFRFGIDIEVKGIMTHEESEMDFLSGGVITVHFFKILKAQKIEKFEEYISTIASQYIDDNIELRVYNTGVISKLKGGGNDKD